MRHRLEKRVSEMDHFSSQFLTMDLHISRELMRREKNHHGMDSEISVNIFAELEVSLGMF
jgi:hypothetical protein